MLKVATVCSGVGSPEVAIKNLNIKHEIVFGCEIDKYARQTYLANFKPSMMLEDMTKEDWEDEKYYSDIIVGGIPCQAFSLAGKRLGELDARGLLFYDFYRYVKNQQPKYFIIENVKGLLSMDKGNVFNNWKALLGQSENGTAFLHNHEDSLMYNLHWKVLNSSNFGLPQNRERVYIVGFEKSINSENFKFPENLNIPISLEDILEDNPNDAKIIERSDIEIYKDFFIEEDIFGNKTLPNKPIQIGKVNKGGQGERIYHPAGHAITLSAYGGGVGSKTGLYKINNQIRKLTVLECFRLQGFPDDYVKPVSSSQLYKQAGNSISVPVIENILKVLLKNHIN